MKGESSTKQERGGERVCSRDLQRGPLFPPARVKTLAIRGAPYKVLRRVFSKTKGCSGPPNKA